MASNNENLIPVNGTSKHENGDDNLEVREISSNIVDQLKYRKYELNLRTQIWF